MDQSVSNKDLLAFYTQLEFVFLKGTMPYDRTEELSEMLIDMLGENDFLRDKIKEVEAENKFLKIKNANQEKWQKDAYAEKQTPAS